MIMETVRFRYGICRISGGFDFDKREEFPRGRKFQPSPSGCGHDSLAGNPAGARPWLYKLKKENILRDDFPAVATRSEDAYDKEDVLLKPPAAAGESSGYRLLADVQSDRLHHDILFRGINQRRQVLGFCLDPDQLAPFSFQVSADFSMKTPTKDLFDDSTMSFGEHLEALRTHLIRAIIGLVFAAVLCLYQGDKIVDFVRRPIDRALKRHSELDVQDDTKQMKQGWDKFREDMGINTFLELFTGTKSEQRDAEKTAHAAQGTEVDPGTNTHPDAITVRVGMEELVSALHSADPERYPPPIPSTSPPGEKFNDSADKTTVSEKKTPPKMVNLTLHAPEFAQFQATVELTHQAVTLNVQEAFMTYLKVSLVAAVILASPWIFYQLWLFVAAGLYPHERKYVYVYGTMSLVLFMAGALFCYYAVFPFVLNFLLGFNSTLKITPQIRLSEWISFAVVLPLMFGISFQLPLVMLFLDRINIFQVETYREQRRMAILVIAILSSILTPADPMSMLLMMFPLIFLYELGIKLCQWMPRAETLDLGPA